MAWFKKDEADLPEALKGKTQEEIEAILNRANELETENATLKTENAATRTQFESFGQTIEEIKGSLQELRTPAKQDNTPAGEPANFLTDPDRAFAERAAPLVGLLLSTSGTMARQQAREAAMLRQRTQKNNMDGTIFDKYIDEIDALAKTCTPQQLASPATWTHLFYNIKGRHADEIVVDAQERKGLFAVEGAQRIPGQEAQQDDKLTAQQLRIAEKMGVKPEAYLKNKKEMVTGAPENI